MSVTIMSGEWNGRVQQIKMEDGIITAVGDIASNQYIGATHIQTDGQLLPGYIDVHVHGGGGAEVMEGTEDAFEQVALTHAKHGTTGLLLTTVTASPEDLDKVFTAYEPKRIRNGAEILGFHLEGPFINPAKPGAQPKEFIIPPSESLFLRWQSRSEGAIRYVTLAPEMEGAELLIKLAVDQGVVVSMGHCNATSSQVSQAIAWGAKSVTHLFNAMSPAGHREPGLAGTALGEDRLMVEIIADLIHVHPLMLKTALRAKGPERVMLITDAVKAADMPEGEYGFGGRRVFVKHGAVRLEDGTLAGSTLTLDRAVRNLLGIHALRPDDVNLVTSLNQSRLLNLPHGRISIGAPANLIAVSADWEVTHTVVRGKLVHRA
ncbi:N-acetylglucosamine-6-phosphate deacetylase [Ferroacidibacillus organovorans]|uniref:N-acetylglucosamine-6-phosphate deacetylase n=1 Tax=Ferroacidibacillus organovorans TaxID=1765683 RepID=A0A1V4EWP5_9BACL|nr:N-acetylglucosamine-6-phosphate deacetylase [Ferroacidibacillus organovorans]OPG17355.1 N-acetylglucosamine-6-phosphate deacetylase [Ferroacidibacillus organovorans]